MWKLIVTKTSEAEIQIVLIRIGIQFFLFFYSGLYTKFVSFNGNLFGFAKKYIKTVIFGNGQLYLTVNPQSCSRYHVPHPAPDPIPKHLSALTVEAQKCDRASAASSTVVFYFGDLQSVCRIRIPWIRVRLIISILIQKTAESGSKLIHNTIWKKLKLVHTVLIRFSH